MEMYVKCFEGKKSWLLIHPGSITDKVELWVALEGEMEVHQRNKRGLAFLGEQRALADIARRGGIHHGGGGSLEHTRECQEVGEATLWKT